MAVENRIPTNLRNLLILEVIGNSDHSLTPTEINAQIGLPKQTVHRLCTTLEAEGFLIREMDGKRLRASRRLRKLAGGLLNSTRVHIMRHQILKDLADQVRESVNFVVPEETGMRYLDRQETDWPFRIQLPVGSNVPFHSTASGKTYMASMSKSARKKFVASLKLDALTDKTHTDTDSLLSDLVGCAKRGYAIDDEEFMDGMVAIAVPVTDPSGRFIAAVAFHGPTPRLSVDAAVAQRNVLLQAANKLKAALFDEE